MCMLKIYEVTDIYVSRLKKTGEPEIHGVKSPKNGFLAIR